MSDTGPTSPEYQDLMHQAMHLAEQLDAIVAERDRLRAVVEAVREYRTVMKTRTANLNDGSPNLAAEGDLSDRARALTRTIDAALDQLDGSPIIGGRKQMCPDCRALIYMDDNGACNDPGMTDGHECDAGHQDENRDWPVGARVVVNNPDSDFDGQHGTIAAFYPETGAGYPCVDVVLDEDRRTWNMPASAIEAESDAGHQDEAREPRTPEEWAEWGRGDGFDAGHHSPAVHDIEQHAGYFCATHGFVLIDFCSCPDDDIVSLWTNERDDDQFVRVLNRYRESSAGGPQVQGDAGHQDEALPCHNCGAPMIQCIERWGPCCATCRHGGDAGHQDEDGGRG